ncbi:MAG: cytochrome c biogenesis protein CcdA [Thermoleophilia bacterium]|nr:cytochrome c biogenesis protein CcdA [Thermoleophilia bacterium]
MLTTAPIAFVAGMLSVLSPCVLPLVPGYLSLVSAGEATRLGEPGVTRRVVARTIPFFLGFTVVFVALGAAAAFVADRLGTRSAAWIAGFVLVVFGLAFMRLLPLPQRVVLPGFVESARTRGSAALLGAAFALCAAPCIGPVLAGVLVLAGDAGTVVRGSALLAVYSAGIAAAFLLAGVGFARALTAFRWVRDRYAAIQVASGAVLVVLGLLLFFERYWWLQVAFRRGFDAVGLRPF